MPWLTPDSLPDDNQLGTLQIPDSEPFRAAVRGALYELTLESNWEQFGTLTPEEVAARFLEMWEDFLMPFSIVGAIMMWPTNSAPNRWLICDGQAVDRVTYATLFNLIGTTYGPGNGSTTFNLPDLRARFPVGRKSDNTRFDSIGETGGQESQSHTHTLDLGGAVTNRAVNLTQFPVWQTTQSPHSLVLSTTTGSTTLYEVRRTMDSQPVETLPPYIVVNFIICAIAS